MIEYYNEDFRNCEFSNNNIIISDPPYNINYGYGEYKDELSDLDYINMIKDIRKIANKIVLIGYPDQFYRYYIEALGYPDYTCTWCYNSNIAQQFRLVGFWGIKPDLSKDFQPYKNPNDKRVKQLIKNGSKGARLYNWWNDIPLVKNVSKDKLGNVHPCPVPIKLMQRIIKITSFNNAIYIDPFNGSGSSGIASYIEKCKFKGYEIDKIYYNNSITLINNYTNQFNESEVMK